MKNKRPIRLGVIAVCLIFGVLSVGCQTGEPQENQESVSITINSWIGWAPLYLAIEKNLFDGVELKITRVEDTGTRKASILAGHVDGYTSSVDNFALDSAEGVPGKIVLCFDESFGGDGIVAKRDINSVNDLKGKQIAFQKGLPSHFLLLTALTKAGLSQSDVKQFDMDADKAGAAFASGQLDAAVTWEPWISKAAEMANGKVLLTTKDFPGLIVDVLVFRDEVIEERPELVGKIVSGWFRALDYWKQNKTEADQIMANSYSLPVDEFEAMCSGVRFYDLEKNIEYFGTPDSPGLIYSVFNAASELWFKAGITSSQSIAGTKIESSFVRNLK